MNPTLSKLCIVPGCYTLLARTTGRGLAGFIAYAPCAYLSFYLYQAFRAGLPVSAHGLLSLALFWLAFLSVYEIGYIYNDTRAVALEPRGFRREAPAAVAEHAGLYIGVRAALAAIIIYLTWQPRSGAFAAVCILTLLFFALHNTRPKAERSPTFCALRFCKHAWPSFLYTAEPIVAAQLASFALIFAVTESFCYQGVGADRRSSVLLVDLGLAYIWFAIVDHPLNWSLYPLSIALLGALRKHLRAAFAQPRSCTTEQARTSS